MSPTVDLDQLVVCSICAAVVYAPEYEGHERWHQHLIDQATTARDVPPARGSTATDPT